MAKPQIVLIPGAGHSPPFMATITSQLQDAGYTVHSRQLPAVGNPNPPSDLSEDIAAVRSLAEEAISEEGNDIIVVPHSWSGIVAGSALANLGKKEREVAGKKGGVVRVAYMAAFILPEGMSLKDSIPGIPDWWDIDGPYVHATSAEIFYNDLPLSSQTTWFSQLQSHSLATLYAPATAASWKNIPTSYLLCEDDQAIPAPAQEAMTSAVREMGSEIEVSRIKAGHCPFLSRPEETVKWIRGAAGESLGSGVDA